MNTNISPEIPSKKQLKHIQSITKYFEIPQLHTTFVKCIIGLSDGRIVTSSDNSLSICKINIPSKEWNLLVTKDNAHEGYIHYLCELSMNRLSSCSEDTTIKIWDITQQNEITLITTIEGQGYTVCQIIPLTKERLVSISEDKTIKLRKDFNYEIINTPFEQQINEPNAVLQLKHQDEVLCVSLIDKTSYNEEGEVVFYNLTAPYEEKGAIKGVFTEWFQGMVEMDNGLIVVSKRSSISSCVVVIINPMTFTVVAEIMDDECISQERAGCLWTNGGNSVVYVCEGFLCEILLKDTKYEISYKKKEEQGELIGFGLVFVDNGKYMLTTNDNDNNGINVYKCEYEYENE